MANKLLSISLSPNTERDDILLALKMLFSSFLWQQGNAPSLLEKNMREYLGSQNAVSFNSGRSALYAILRCLNVSSGDIVLLQAFTCNAVVNPILWTGASPFYIDCDKNSYNMDVIDLERNIALLESEGKHPKALIVQHTFGKPADVGNISRICKAHIILIEDCAHALGATYQGKPVGSFGEASFFSFGRDKVLSCVYGGMAIAHTKELAELLRHFQEECSFPSSFWVLQQLLHPILLPLWILPTYKFGGKYFFEAMKRARILSKAVSMEEKKGVRPSLFPLRLPNALARLVLLQWKKLERYNLHRNAIAEIYFQELASSSFSLPMRDKGDIFLRFSIRHKKAKEIRKRAKKENILLGDWYDTPIAPYDTNLESMEYTKGSCPCAESLGDEVLNLPTHVNISKEDAHTICAFLLSLEKELSGDIYTPL
jgi:dTDP-4-amino-4,6-dideoxygalactose transaminase